MKKLFLFTWMMMLSIVAMAQSVIVVDKDGNRIPYDPAKVSSVDFQVTPPGFTVNHETASDLYTFDKVQSLLGLEGPKYINIDWEKTTLDSYDAETGVTVITFADEVPDMDRLDCFVMPESQNYAIRVIESVDKVEGKTATLTTSEGDMGNLFKDTQIVLGFGNKAEAAARARGLSADNIIYPVKVELFDGKNYTEVYNADKAKTRGDGDDDEDGEGDEEEAEENKTSAKTKIKMDCELEDFILLSDNYASANLDKFSYNVNLSGLMFLTFTKKEWYEFWKGELSDVLVDLHGHRDYNIEATHTVKSLGERRDEQVNEADYIEPALASKTMIFTFIKDGKVIRASVKMNLHACEFGYLAQGIGSAKTHISNSTDFIVADDNEIDYSNTNDDVYDTPLSMENATTEGLFAYSFNGDFSINMFGEDVFNAEYQIGNNVSFGRKTAQTPEMVNEVEGNSASIEVFKDFIAWDVTTNTDNMIRQRFADTYLIPYGLELNGAEKDIDVDINVKKSHKLTFHAYHQDHNGHRYDSKDAVVYVEIVSPSIIQNYYDVLDENGNLTMDFNYKSLDHGGTVTVTLCNLYYENLPNYTLPKRVWTFHPKGFDIDCLTRGTVLGIDQESVDMKFRLRKYERGEWKNAVEKGVFFSVEPGEVDPTYERTNEEGIVTTTFKQDSPDFDYATLEATYRIKEPDDTYEGGTSELIFKEHKSEITDEKLKKVEKLKPGEYVVKNKKTGKEETRNYSEKWSEWDKDQDFVKFTLEDADANGGTRGMVYGFIPKSLINRVLSLSKKQFENSPGAKVGFGLYEGQEVSGNFMTTTDMTEGNISDLSRIMLRMIKSLNSPTRAAADEYTGEYELLFYLEFKNEVWNNETNQMEEGDEYEVYGRGTMKMHVPSVTSFVANTEKDWVKVGESTKVTLEQYYEEGATWDWNDTQIIGQSTDYSEARNGKDEGFFSYDAATQTLTSLKSNNNDWVWVCIGLKSNPEVKNSVMVATGDGWNYTMIKTSTDVIECKANSYPSFDFDWAPKDIELDFNALELDPDCAPAGYFAFPSGYQWGGWPVFVSSKCEPGEYNLKFRVKSNHDVNCTVKFIVSPEE